MRFCSVLIPSILSAAVCLCASQTDAQSTEARPNAPQGLPARVAPTDYQSHAQAGPLTIAAEFVGHSVPTGQGTLTTEEYVVVEVALYGPRGAETQISIEDFSLQLNGKKNPLPSRPYGLVVSSLKDPEWNPPESEQSKSSKPKTSFGGQGDSSGPPPPVKIPIEVQRSMAQRTKKAALAIGNRPLPQAGLLFFQHRGKVENITSAELIYNGPGGKATVALVQQ